MAEDVVFTPVRQLAEGLRPRRLSPVALAEKFLERLERLGPRYNAVVTITRELALDAGARAERGDRGRALPRAAARHPLRRQGPAGDAGGIPTTWGAAPFRDQRFDYDATVVRKLRGPARCWSPSSPWSSWRAGSATPAQRLVHRARA